MSHVGMLKPDPKPVFGGFGPARASAREADRTHVAVARRGVMQMNSE